MCRSASRLSNSVSTIVPSAATELASPHTFAMSSFRYALTTRALARSSFSLVTCRVTDAVTASVAPHLRDVELQVRVDHPGARTVELLAGDVPDEGRAELVR